MMIPFYFPFLLQSQSSINIWTEMIFLLSVLSRVLKKEGSPSRPHLQVHRFVECKQNSSQCALAKWVPALFWPEVSTEIHFWIRWLQVSGRVLGSPYREGAHVIHCSSVWPLWVASSLWASGHCDCSVFPTRIQVGTLGIIQDYLKPILIVGASLVTQW